MILQGVMVLLILQVLDSYSTLQVLRRGGVERNPIMRYLMGTFGVKTAVIACKGLGTVVFLYVLYLGFIPTVVLWCVNVVYCVVVVNNFRHLRKQKEEK